MTKIITGTTTTIMAGAVMGTADMEAVAGIGTTAQTGVMKAGEIIVARIGRGVVAVEGMGVKKTLLVRGTVCLRFG
jgi:hypothetical protein